MNTTPDSSSEKDAFDGEATFDGEAAKQESAKQNGWPGTEEAQSQARNSNPDFRVVPHELKNHDQEGHRPAEFIAQPEIAEDGSQPAPHSTREVAPWSALPEEPLFEDHEFIPPPP